jgi:hypothetical protein
MQLVAYGAQDVYLTGNPQITFWKVTYRRHTNFAMESIEQTFNGQADFGRRVQCTISRNGDLAYRTYLQVTLPEINQTMGKDGSYAGVNDVQNAVYARWLDYPGEQLVSMVEVEIGGQRIDRQYGDWMHIWNQLTLTAEAERGYNKMVGQTTQLTYLCDPTFAAIDTPCASDSVPNQVCVPRDALPETTLYVPLQFWFCRNPGLALPLIALQYHEVKINLELSPIQQCLYAVKQLAGCSAGNDVKVANAYKQSLVAASLYVDYVFLDTDERRRMAQNPHEYLIEQLQFTGAESVGSSSNRIKLNFNHPCKELVWVVQPDANVDYCNQTVCGATLYRALGAQPFNYTDAVDALPNTMRAFAADGTAGGTDGNPSDESEFISGDIFADVQPNVPSSAMLGEPDWGANQFNSGGTQVAAASVDALPGGDKVSGSAGAEKEAIAASGSTVSDAGAFVLAETALNMHCWGENPVVTAKLQLNGQDRFSEREGSYFDLVQPYQHHTRNPDTGINVYSFALRPEEHQPSGTCNMSRIDNASLQLVLSTNAIGGTATAKVRVYATNYNVLRVMSGMGGLAYSN